MLLLTEMKFDLKKKEYQQDFHRFYFESTAKRG